MSLLIKGMEMPKAGSWKTIRIYHDGTCAEPNWQGDCKFMRGCEAVSVPSPHGRLMDADAFKKTIRPITEEDDFNGCTFRTVKELMKKHIDNAPTIIEAEGE